jgi:thioesterase domain-containing protein/aryl carrier-like protein
VTTTIAGVPPHSEKEGVVLLMAQHVLGRDDFGITDDLFDLGLTSITAIKLAAMSAACGVQISVNNLMRLRTIERLFTKETPIGYWFNGYNPDKPVLIVPHGVVPVIAMTDKFHEWEKYFSIYTIEPTDEHAAKLAPDYDYEKLVKAYSGYLHREIPEDAHLFGFIGFSWGGEVVCSLVNQWQQERGAIPNVYICDTYLNEPDAPKMTEEQVTQGLLQYFFAHADDFDISALQSEQSTDDGSSLLNAAFMKCSKDVGFAGEMLKMISRKFYAGELCRRIQPLPVYNGHVTFFACTRENPELAEELAKWRKITPEMEVVNVDDNHINFMIRNNNNYVITERLQDDLKRWKENTEH